MTDRAQAAAPTRETAQDEADAALRAIIIRLARRRAREDHLAAFGGESTP